MGEGGKNFARRDVKRRNNLEDDTNNYKIDRYGTKFLDKVGAAGREKIGKRYWIDNR